MKVLLDTDELKEVIRTRSSEFDDNCISEQELYRDVMKETLICLGKDKASRIISDFITDDMKNRTIEERLLEEEREYGWENFKKTYAHRLLMIIQQSLLYYDASIQASVDYADATEDNERYFIITDLRTAHLDSITLPVVLPKTPDMSLISAVESIEDALAEAERTRKKLKEENVKRKMALDKLTDEEKRLLKLI